MASHVYIHDVMHTLIRYLTRVYLLLQALERLNSLLELNIQSLGNETREEKVWDAILDVRLDISKLKSERQVIYSAFFIYFH